MLEDTKNCNQVVGKRVMVTVRMSEEERDLIKEAAWCGRMTVNEYCRRVLLEKSRRVVEKRWE